MKLPILILGYERSGTTLMRHLVSMHPDLSADLVHEKVGALWDSSSLDEAAGRLSRGTQSLMCGQKVPYIDSTPAERALKKFAAYFGSFRIIHMVRNPVDCIASQVATFGRNPDKMARHYCKSVPRVAERLRAEPDVLVIQYESFVASPEESLSKLYAWMGRRPEDDYIARVLSTQGRWLHNNRTMPGIGRHSVVGPTKPHSVLSNEQANRIKTMCRESHRFACDPIGAYH